MSVIPTRTRVTSDSALVTGMAAGDEQALAALYDRYGAIVYSLAYAMIGDPSAAEEVVAGVFARVWREAAGFVNTRATVLGWLTSLARERARTEQKRGVGRKPASAGRAGAPVERAAGMERASRLRGEPEPSRSAIVGALGELSDVQRKVVELAFLGGLTVRDVARQLDLPESSAREQLQSAMNSLRLAVGPRDASLDRAMATSV